MIKNVWRRIVPQRIFLRARKMRSGDWSAWAGFVPLIAENSILEPEEHSIFFGFGNTEEAAIESLKADMKAKFNVKDFVQQK